MWRMVLSNNGDKMTKQKWEAKTCVGGHPILFYYHCYHDKLQQGQDDKLKMEN